MAIQRIAPRIKDAQVANNFIQAQYLICILNVISVARKFLPKSYYYESKTLILLHEWVILTTAVTALFTLKFINSYLSMLRDAERPNHPYPKRPYVAYCMTLLNFYTASIFAFSK